MKTNGKKSKSAASDQQLYLYVGMTMKLVMDENLGKS